MNGIPDDWVRIEIVETDEISVLELGPNLEDARESTVKDEVGEWELRERYMVKWGERKAWIWGWLDGTEETDEVEREGQERIDG